MHDFPGEGAAAAIDGVHPVVPFLRSRERFDGSVLHRLELAGVDVALDFQHPLDELGVRGEHGHAPARHVVRLAHGVHLDANLLCPRDAEDAEGVFVEDEAVGVVVTYNNIVATAEVH